MKTATIRTVSAAGTLAAASLISMSSALAEGPWDFSANIGAVSNYMWRGVTQTGDGAAVQGGLDVAHESGFYIGTWASNIDWDNGSQDVSTSVTGTVVGATDDDGNPLLDADGYPVPLRDADGNIVIAGTGEGATGGDPSPNYELDLYAGYDYAINDDFSIGVSGIYYAYPDGRESDFAEVGLSGSYKWFTLGAAYTVYGENDKGLFDDGDWYFYGSAEFTLPYDFAFGVHGGYYDFRYDDVPVGIDPITGLDVTESADYWHYGASISKEAGDFGTFGFHWDQNSGSQRVGYDPEPKFWVSWNKEF
jgi:hypothetical protein